VLQMADQLVITTVPREDAAFTADWMLDLLYDNGLGDLVSNAVTLLSCPTPNPSGLLQDLATHFATRTRAVAVVPYDPMLERGSWIDHRQLAPATGGAGRRGAGGFGEPFVRCPVRPAEHACATGQSPEPPPELPPQPSEMSVTWNGSRSMARGCWSPASSPTLGGVFTSGSARPSSARTSAIR